MEDDASSRQFFAFFGRPRLRKTCVANLVWITFRIDALVPVLDNDTVRKFMNIHCFVNRTILHLHVVRFAPFIMRDVIYDANKVRSVFMRNVFVHIVV